MTVIITSPVDSNEVTLDVFMLNSDSTDIVSVSRDVGIYVFGDMERTVEDFAQSFYTDTAMRIYGVSIPFWCLQYRNMHPYICIADSNFVIQKKPQFSVNMMTQTLFQEKIPIDSSAIKKSFLINP